MMHGPQRPVHTPFLASPHSSYLWKKDQRNNNNDKPRSLAGSNNSLRQPLQQQQQPQYFVPTSSSFYMPSAAVTSAPSITLQKQSEPASPSTIATTISSHHPTPSPSPARIAIMSDSSNNGDYTLFDDHFLPDMQTSKQLPAPSAHSFGSSGHASPNAQYGAPGFPVMMPQENYPSMAQDVYGSYSTGPSQQCNMMRNQYAAYPQGGYEATNTNGNNNIKVEDEELPGLSPNPKRARFSSTSARQSVSSVDTYRSPATPVQAPDVADDVVLGTSVANPPTNHVQNALPKLGRTYSDAVQDELYNPELISNDYTPYSNVYTTSTQQPQLHQHHNSGSTSPYSVNSSTNFVNLNAYGQSMDQQQGMAKNGTPKTTISPREALLEYTEPEGGDVAQMNLFNPLSDSSRNSSRADSDYEDIRSQSSRRESIATSSSSHVDGFRYGNIDQLGGNSYNSTAYLNGHSHQAPRHYSMDSGIERPLNTRADTGAYTCTFSGCGQRFTTSGKLQKHRREAHRKSTPTANSVSTAAAIASRNAQPGPHRCMRPNPSTGKPCNTVFSRPYDLTRHEDTIHNAQKQKVRCEICTDEKTFSRPDALVRHRRVKHGIH